MSRASEASSGENAAAIALLVPSGIWYAWVIHWLWGWFIVSLGAPALTPTHAYGISCLIAMFDHTRPNPDTTSLEDCGASLLKSTVILGMGYLVHCLGG